MFRRKYVRTLYKYDLCKSCLGKKKEESIQFRDLDYLRDIPLIGFVGMPIHPNWMNFLN